MAFYVQNTDLECVAHSRGLVLVNSNAMSVVSMLFHDLNACRNLGQTEHVKFQRLRTDSSRLMSNSMVCQTAET